MGGDYAQVNVKTVLFKTLQFSISTLFSSIWPIDRTISGATTPGQCAPGSDGNKDILRLPQNSSITGASLSDCLMSYSVYSLVVVGVLYSPTDWPRIEGVLPICIDAIVVFYRPTLLLYIDLRLGQTCHSKVIHRKEVTHPDGSNEKKSLRRTWLTIWDKVKSHGTGKNWCTGRGWHVNCMTVISAWWQSNMPFQRLSGRLNYYITRRRQEVSELEIRWVNDKKRKREQYPAEWSSGPPIEQPSRTRKTQRWWP